MSYRYLYCMSGRSLGVLPDAIAPLARNDACREAASTPVIPVNNTVTVIAGIACALLWLLLLEATDFGPMAVSVGLLGALVLMGLPNDNGHYPGRKA
ncbi:MAG: hypothetical protein NVS2B16_04800 [Chloroflexota bacterium]